jgi:hypothetical protein
MYASALVTISRKAGRFSVLLFAFSRAVGKEGLPAKSADLRPRLGDRVIQAITGCAPAPVAFEVPARRRSGAPGVRSPLPSFAQG